MASRLCKTDSETYQLLKEESKVLIGESPEVFHRHLLGEVLNIFPDNLDMIGAVLKNNPTRFDLAKVMQFGNIVVIKGKSSEFDYPKPNDLPMLREKTIEVLRTEYPDLEIMSS